MLTLWCRKGDLQTLIFTDNKVALTLLCLLLSLNLPDICCRQSLNTFLLTFRLSETAEVSTLEKIFERLAMADNEKLESELNTAIPHTDTSVLLTYTSEPAL